METLLEVAIKIKKEYKDILEPLGDFQGVVNNALRRYVLDIGSERVEKCEIEIKKLEEKYHCSFKTFLSKVGTDKDITFLQQLEEKYPMWESDFNLWETCITELNKWKEKMSIILKG